MEFLMHLDIDSLYLLLYYFCSFPVISSPWSSLSDMHFAFTDIP